MERQGLFLEGFAAFGMRPRSRVLTRLALHYLGRRPALAMRYEERFLRLTAASRPPIIICRGEAADFLRQAPGMDGAVTAWRLEPPAGSVPDALIA